MKILKSLSVFFLIILTAATCQKPQISNTITIVSSQKTNIDAGAQTITIEFATDCKTFQVSIDSKWVQIQEAVGLKYTFSVDENTAEARVAKITASGNNAESLVVSISQAAAGQPQEYTSLTDVRELYNDGQNNDKYNLAEEVKLKAIVISDYRAANQGGLNNYTSKKAIIISDGVAGIMLFCDKDNTYFGIGDEVQVVVAKGQEISRYNGGSVQINGQPLDNVTKLEAGKALAPIEISSADLLSGNYESMYVAVNDVQVQAAAMGKTFVSGDSHTSIEFVSKTGDAFVVFSSKYSSFGDEIVPIGSGTLKGINMVYGQTSQISITSQSDYEGLVEERFAVGGEDSQTVSLHTVRDMYQGSATTITENISVEGTVISNYHSDGLDNYTSLKTIIVSDGTTGLMLYCSGDNSLYKFGDKVRISLKNQKLDVYDEGPLQINGLPLDNIELLGTEDMPAIEITAAELVSGQYESVYVAVKDVQINDADLCKCFVVDGEHTHIAFDGKNGESFDLFSGKHSSFGAETVPIGSGVLKGIAGTYKGRAQISLAKMSDIDGLNGDRFTAGAAMTLYQSGYTHLGDAGSVEIQLLSSVDWTASCDTEGFNLSKTEGSGSAYITVSFGANSSTEASRVATITFKAIDAIVADVVFTLTQLPYKALKSDAVVEYIELPMIDMTSDSLVYISHDLTHNGDPLHNYSLLFDARSKVSRWVAYKLYDELLDQVTSRTDEWAYDPKLPIRDQANIEKRAYTKGVRGHQLPSGDRLFSVDANEQTFYASNIIPQNADMNSEIWASLESKIRVVANDCDTLYVVTGPLLTTEEGQQIEYTTDVDGKRVAYPRAFFKVLLQYQKESSAFGGYSAIGFVIENNTNTDTKISSKYAKSVDEIEALSGFDFFHNLSNEWESDVERTFDAYNWGL